MAASRPPVILVPGAFGQDLAYWNVQHYLLERDGFHVYTLTFPRLTLVDLRKSARLLADKVDEVLSSEGVTRVALVAHSMGGLIARYYLQHLGGRNKVLALVCLGTPHQGTYAGLAAPVLLGMRQITPGSAFLARLNAPGADPPEVPITNIWSRVDAVVVPPKNARLDGPSVRDVRLQYAGHWALLISPFVYRTIREALEADTPAGAVKTSSEASAARDPHPV